MMNYYELESILMIVAIMAVIGVVLLFALAGYLFSAIGMYQMAKKKNLEHPWFAWVPFTRSYLLGELVNEKVKFGSLIIPYANWVLLGISIAGGMLISIPYLGVVISLAIILYSYACHYRLYKLYKPESATVYLIFSVIFFWVPLLSDIFVFTLRKQDPVEYLSEPQAAEPQAAAAEDDVVVADVVTEDVVADDVVAEDIVDDVVTEDVEVKSDADAEDQSDVETVETEPETFDEV